ncbi:calcium-binding mitochondrial carrier protein SCaMC-1-B isoform X2 [Cimex lectularius]|uniref:EF-hand domain-containing protein n=1 Tax=Cimex lectularius TaxID=79782 RepID=A0A8I6SHW7_CIMLE|nr:calcium-binding mitochondrial carrier protein SCaMC-1-B isoform X2 [Cimex lectularius]
MVNAHVSISTDPVTGHLPHYFHELPYEDEKRLEKLFNSLDLDGNGKIDIHDLSVALREFGVDHKYAQSFLERADVNKSSDISLAEFIHYVKEHEKNLRLGFSHIDKNRDGKIDLEELIKAFQELGVEVEVKEAKKLLERMDTDGSLEISFNEWRDFLLYAPYSNIHDLIHYWRHHAFLDIGDLMTVPEDYTAKEIQTGVWWRQLVAGAVAGAVSRTCTAPLDRIKTFLQVHGSKGSMTMKSCWVHMLNEGGIMSLWRGNGINVTKIAPESALKFFFYEKIKAVIRKKNQRKELAIQERFVAGSLAGALSQTTIYPLEVLKTRLALRNTGEYSGVYDALKKIIHREGIKAFYKGYVPNILGILPYAGIDLAVYETLKNAYILQFAKKTDQPPNALVLLSCGTASSTCGQAFSYPLALVRTRLQAQGPGTQPDTMITMIQEILKKDGFLGMYRGIGVNFLKVAPSVGISYIVYEKMRVVLGLDNMT